MGLKDPILIDGLNIINFIQGILLGVQDVNLSNYMLQYQGFFNKNYIYILY